MKSVAVAYVLWFFCGLLGVHRCYLDSGSIGVLYFFTAGLFFIGWIVDLCLIPGLVDECNQRRQPVVIVTGGNQTTNNVVQYQQPVAGSPYAQYPPQGYPQQQYPPQGYPPAGYGGQPQQRAPPPY